MPSGRRCSYGCFDAGRTSPPTTRCAGTLRSLRGHPPGTGRGVRDPESVADHSYGMALLALVAPLPAGVDRDRLIRLALVHDLAEARVGDLTPGELPRAEKHAREAAAMRDLAALLPEPDGARL